jgi:hypothetical protein
MSLEALRELSRRRRARKAQAATGCVKSVISPAAPHAATPQPPAPELQPEPLAELDAAYEMLRANDTDENMQRFAMAAIRAGLPFYGGGDVDRGPDGWHEWAGLPPPVTWPDADEAAWGRVIRGFVAEAAGDVEMEQAVSAFIAEYGPGQPAPAPADPEDAYWAHTMAAADEAMALEEAL